MRERIKKIYEEILSPGRTFQEKLFIILTVIAEIAVFLVCIGDIIIRDNTIEIVILMGMLLASFPIVYFTVKKKRTDIGALLIASGVVFLVLPVTYFFGGGITGGSDLWLTFAFPVRRNVSMTVLSIRTPYLSMTSYCAAITHCSTPIFSV